MANRFNSCRGILRRLFCLFVPLGQLTAAAAFAGPIPDGAASFEFVDAAGNADRPIKVWTYRPEDLSSDSRVVIVMHGQGRNGKVYRDSWIEFAKQQGFLLLTPEFSNENYPSEEMYQQGFILSADGTPRDKAKWSLTAIEHLFDYVVRENALSATRYTIYGHSGGGQFVHRLVLLCPEARIDLAVAANPGWYTMPTFDITYPYGLKSTPLEPSQLEAALAKPLVILLGEDDTDSKHKSLRRTPEAMLQGRHRFERGHRFFEQGKHFAEQKGADFNWQLKTVPHVNHSNAKMAPAAARILDQHKSDRVDTSGHFVGPWNLSALKQKPRATWGEKRGSVQEVYYEGEPLAGKPTRVFAYVARPEGIDHRVPGMILVHGGGGTAFAEWAKLWAARGYAAIAIDLSGNGPGGKKLPDGGPPLEDSTVFRDFTEAEAKEMWTYHAMAAVLRGHSLLAACKEVDADRIGITGISWGGYLTCIAAGVDERVKVAVPVYGCGFLYGNSHHDWLNAFAKMKPEVRTRWISLFDPSTYLPRVRCPILFVNGTNDFAFPLDSYQKSCQLVPGKVDLRIEVNMPHGHEAGWAPKEIELFVDSVLIGGDPLPRLGEMTTAEGQVSAEFVAKQPVVHSQLHFTSDTGAWEARKWNSADAKIADHKVYADLPKERPLTYFLSVTDERGAMTSAPHVMLP